MRSANAACFLALTIAGPAMAKDEEGCLPGLICASAPATVVKGLQDAGYKAHLLKDKAGDPKINTAAGGRDYSIYFYGCDKGAKCDSLQFSIGYTNEGNETFEIVNKWNSKKRFGKAYMDEKGQFWLEYDVTTIGGINSKHFADIVSWWESVIGEVAAFWKEYPAPKKGGAKT